MPRASKNIPHKDLFCFSLVANEMNPARNPLTKLCVLGEIPHRLIKHRLVCITILKTLGNIPNRIESLKMPNIDRGLLNSVFMFISIPRALRRVFTLNPRKKPASAFTSMFKRQLSSCLHYSVFLQ